VALEQGNTQTQISASDPIYGAGSDLYTRGEIVERPPSAPDFEGLPPRPSADAVRDIRIDLENGRAALAQSRQARAKYAAHLISLEIAAERGAEDEATQAALARLAALDIEAELMADAFPAAREEERSQLREQFVTSPERLASVLEAKVGLEAAREEQFKGQAAFDEQRLKAVDAAEARYQRRELEYSARLLFWGVATNGDMRRLRQGGADAGRIPARQQPSP